MFGDISGCHNQEEGAKGLLWVEVKDAANQPTVHRTAADSKGFAGPKCQTANAEKPCTEVTSGVGDKARMPPRPLELKG